MTARVTDLKGVTEVKLMYKAGNGSFTAVNMTAGSNYQYSGKIAPQAPSTVVQYYVSATNVSDLTGTLPADAPASTNAYTVGAPSIVINEAY